MRQKAQTPEDPDDTQENETSTFSGNQRRLHAASNPIPTVHIYNDIFQEDAETGPIWKRVLLSTDRWRWIIQHRKRGNNF